MTIPNKDFAENEANVLMLHGLRLRCRYWLLALHLGFYRDVRQTDHRDTHLLGSGELSPHSCSG